MRGPDAAVGRVELGLDHRTEASSQEAVTTQLWPTSPSRNVGLVSAHLPYFLRDVRNLDFLLNYLILLGWAQFYLNTHMKWEDKTRLQTGMGLSPSELEGREDQLLVFWTHCGHSSPCQGPGERCHMVSCPLAEAQPCLPFRGCSWEPGPGERARLSCTNQPPRNRVPCYLLPVWLPHSEVMKSLFLSERWPPKKRAAGRRV